MANRFWTGGANDGDWGNTNNWAATEGGASGASVPGADDVYVQAGSQAITSGLTTGAAFTSLTVNFAGSIGTASTPLRFTCAGNVIIRTDVGTHYIAATSAGTIATTRVEKTGIGKVYLSGPGAFTTIYAGANVQIDIASDAAVTTLESAGATINAAANGTVFTTLNIGSGSVESYRGATTANVVGTLRTRGTAAAIGTVNIFNGGKHINWSSSTITLSATFPGGSASSKGSPYNFTVATRKIYENSKNYHDSTNATVTNTDVVVGSGNVT